MLRTIALLLNFIVSIGSVGFAVSAVICPAALSGSPGISASERFFARMYSARAIPFGLVSGLLPLFSRGTAVLWIIFTAAVVQFLDVVIAHRKHDRKMMLGAGVGTAAHLTCLLALF